MICKKLFIKFCRLSWRTTLIPIISYVIFIFLILNFTLPSSNYKLKNLINLKQYSNNSNNNLNLKYNLENVNDIIENYKNQKNKLYLSPEPKTVIIGNSINEKNILKAAFQEANTNHDQYLSIQELSYYINKRIHKHIDNAIKMNPIQFSKIDISPKDGLITWEEYYVYFLNERGLNQKYNIIVNRTKQNQNINENTKNRNDDVSKMNTINIKPIKLDYKTKEDMKRDKILWSEAARTDPFTLTIEEFLAFRHPESSVYNLLSLVDDLLRLFDMDGDEHLTIDEFSDVTVDEIDEKYRKSIISRTVEKRHEEFEKILDKNHDGKADRNELLFYVDPKHPRYALQEALTLLNLTDINRDKMLSMDEILQNSNIFMTSKMIDTSSSFHEEF